MTAYVAATIRRYLSEVDRSAADRPPLEALDARAAAALGEERDLPPEDLLLLLEHLAAAGPPDIALRCGGGRRLAELGVVGHAIASSRTLGGALQIAVAHGAGEDVFRHIDYQMRGSEWIVEVRAEPHLDPAVRRLLCEDWIATFFAYLAEVTRITRPAVRIQLDYAPNAEVDYGRWLPVRPDFGKRRCRLILPASLLDQPLLSYDHDMLQLILKHFAERPVERDYSARVRRYLVLNEGSPPRLAAAAAGMGMSARTLIRRLMEEGTTFSALLDDHRRGYALALARDARLGLKQISAALGYRNVQSFKRAFVQWTGKPLGQWRRDMHMGNRAKPEIPPDHDILPSRDIAKTLTVRNNL